MDELKIEKKHIVKFMGGLANQLFQLCLFFRLCEEYGSEVVYADLSFYKKNKDHGGYKLQKWFSLREVKRLPKILFEITENNFDERNINRIEYCFYNGYWQDTYFFPSNMEFMKKVINEDNLADKNKELLCRIKDTQSVSVHVRRGDYVENPVHGNIANQQYIENAISYINSSLNNPVFFVFSDDPKWCENSNIFENVECYYVKDNENRVEQDIILMSLCKHNIIANSSFSWWAQYYNTNKNKVVIAPEYWFNQKVLCDKLNYETFIHIKNVPINKERFEQPYFSIIIPIYNKEFSIRRAMASVLNQSFKNFEVIIVEDGSTDKSYEIINEYARNDQRIKLIKNDENYSALVSRIIAMHEIKGKYVIFMDCDDYIVEDMCAILYDQLNNNNTDILEYAYIREPEKKIVREIFSYDEEYMKKILKREIPHTIWNKCYSSELIKNALEDMKSFYCNMTEDGYIMSIIAYYTRSYRRIDNVLYHYVSEGGMSNDRRINRQTVLKTKDSFMAYKIAMTEFVEKKKKEYLPALESGDIEDLRAFAYIYVELNQSIRVKMDYLDILDKAFGTHFLDKYEKYLEKMVELYEDYHLGGRKHKMKLACIWLLKTIGKLIKRPNVSENLF